MPRWRLFYHLVWATRGRELLIDEVAEQTIRRSIQTKCRDERGVLHAIGTMPDHIHVVVSIPPNVTISTFVGRLKGASAHAVNEKAATVSFAWQAEYGVTSFAEKDLERVVSYVLHQPERHAAQQLSPAMEALTENT